MGKMTDTLQNFRKTILMILQLLQQTIRWQWLMITQNINEIIANDIIAMVERG